MRDPSSAPLAGAHTKGKVRVILNSAPGRIKTAQRCSVSRHRRANLSFVPVTDKPPFNRRLCVKNVSFFSPFSVSPLPPSPVLKAKRKCCSTFGVRGFFRAFPIWTEEDSQVGVAL